jgi:DNA-binding beta-propeller fold protein YncE
MFRLGSIDALEEGSMRKLGIALPAMLALSALLGSPASANIPVGAATHAVAINQTTGLAYVGAACICGGSVFVIDTATDTVVTAITTVSTPTQIAIDEERNQIFAAHFTGGGVSVIDGNTNTVVTTLTAGGLGLAVDPARDRLYATLGLGGMAVYDLNTLALITTVVHDPPLNWWGVAVNPVTDRIYLAILGGAVSVLDGETFTDQVVSPIPIGLGEGRFGITVDIARNLIYVPRYASAGRILVINGASNTIVGVAGAGSFPTALALDAAHGHLYSADRNSGTVSVLSTQGALTFLSTISVGGTPTGVALPTLGPGRLYVTNSLSGDVTVIPLNAPPTVISATIAPTSPDTDDVLTATVVAQDPDGDPLTYSYQWTKNGGDIAGALGATLNLALGDNGDRGDQIAVRVTASDGSATSSPLTSASVTVINSAPSVSVTLDPIKPSHKDMVTAEVAVSDADLDSIMLTYVWRVEGQVRRTVTTTATSDLFDLSLPHNGSPHDTITVTVTPNDGFTDGAAAMATAFVLPGN